MKKLKTLYLTESKYYDKLTKIENVKLTEKQNHTCFRNQFTVGYEPLIDISKMLATKISQRETVDAENISCGQSFKKISM